MTGFILNMATVIINTDFPGEPVVRAVKRFRRDMEMALRPLGKLEKGNHGMIRLSRRNLPDDHFRICLSEWDELVVEAGNELGIIYGLCHLSRKYLGILPFWFWNDQSVEKKQAVCVEDSLYEPEPFPVKFRGWFINDEVLLAHWDGGVDREYPWEMAFEALLRCGGNLVIPGTEKNAKKYEQLASAMGLWITHDSEEPLGAEMFARVYPDKEPSYKKHPLAFHKLWEETVKRQMNQKVIWNIGFKEQGDAPFWKGEPSLDTPEKRGKMLSSILKKQSSLVKQYVKNPVLSTSLHGETLELYRQGYLILPEDVIMIWEDNGYGKMVSRRQGSHNLRIPAQPDGSMKSMEHGAYYHVSFYDLQAANHITMLPNSTRFVGRELREAYENGSRSLWLVDSSNIKPHVFTLDFIASLWSGRNESPREQMRRYLEEYYKDCVTPEGDTSLRDQMEACFLGYYETALSYGPHEDEHAGEQFYNYVTRELAWCWIRKMPCEDLSWCTEEDTLKGQVRWYRTFCEGGVRGYASLLKQCRALTEAAGPLWEDSLLLQVRIYYSCIRGAVEFCKAFEAFEKESYLTCFYLLGQAMDQYRHAVEAMDRSSHDKWKGFYENECLTDVKETVHMLQRMMSYIRILGDGPYFYLWQRQVDSVHEDRNVLRITNMENHMTDHELYEAMKKQKAEAMKSEIRTQAAKDEELGGAGQN